MLEKILLLRKMHAELLRDEIPKFLQLIFKQLSRQNIREREKERESKSSKMLTTDLGGYKVFTRLWLQLFYHFNF